MMVGASRIQKGEAREGRRFTAASRRGAESGAGVGGCTPSSCANEVCFFAVTRPKCRPLYLNSCSRKELDQAREEFEVVSKLK